MNGYCSITFANHRLSTLNFNFEVKHGQPVAKIWPGNCRPQTKHRLDTGAQTPSRDAHVAATSALLASTHRSTRATADAQAKDPTSTRHRLSRSADARELCLRVAHRLSRCAPHPRIKQ